MPWLYTGKVIREGRGWTDNDGVQHPRNWAIWSDEEKESKGLVWEEPAASFDNRYYWNASTAKSLVDINEVDEDGDPLLDADGVQVVTKGLKTTHKEKTREIANSMLASTDWYVIRKSERDVAIPSNVATYRAAVLTQADEIITAIDAAADIDAFIAIYTNTTDADDNVVVAVGNDWPVLED
jgi:hypothetical protein